MLQLLQNTFSQANLIIMFCLEYNTMLFDFKLYKRWLKKINRILLNKGRCHKHPMGGGMYQFGAPPPTVGEHIAPISSRGTTP